MKRNCLRRRGWSCMEPLWTKGVFLITLLVRSRGGPCRNLTAVPVKTWWQNHAVHFMTMWLAVWLCLLSWAGDFSSPQFPGSTQSSHAPPYRASVSLFLVSFTIDHNFYFLRERIKKKKRGKERKKEKRAVSVTLRLDWALLREHGRWRHFRFFLRGVGGGGVCPDYLGLYCPIY